MPFNELVTILPVSPHSRTAARSACSRHALTVTLPTMSFSTFTSPPTSDFTLLFSVIVFFAACAYVALLAYNHRDVLPRGIVIYFPHCTHRVTAAFTSRGASAVPMAVSARR